MHGQVAPIDHASNGFDRQVKGGSNLLQAHHLRRRGQGRGVHKHRLFRPRGLVGHLAGAFADNLTREKTHKRTQGQLCGEASDEPGGPGL